MINQKKITESLSLAHNKYMVLVIRDINTPVCTNIIMWKPVTARRVGLFPQITSFLFIRYVNQDSPFLISFGVDK